MPSPIRLALCREKKRAAAELQLHSDQRGQYTSPAYFDDTAYLPGKDGPTISAENFYEKLSVKVEYPHTVSASIGNEVTLTNTTATVYGDYQNQSSITAEGLEVVKHAAKDKG